jgi:hypothetical protein
MGTGKMQNMNKSWIITLCAALGLFLALLSLPVYSDESTAQTRESGAGSAEGTVEGTVEGTAEGTGDTAIETTTETTDENTEQTATTTAPADTPVKAPPRSEHVVRALLTTGIENREPVDEIVSINKNQQRIYFFTELADLKGKMIKHRWDFNGKTMGEVDFNVGSNKWRCYSSKNLLPEWTGIWTVSVIDENNNVLAETYFEVTE